MSGTATNRGERRRRGQIGQGRWYEPKRSPRNQPGRHPLAMPLQTGSAWR